MRDELTDFHLSHFPQVLLVVKENEAANPADVGPLSAQAEVLDTNDSPNLIKQLRVDIGV